MPLGFILIGVLLVVIGARGQATNAGALLASEFTGPNSFVNWFLAILILGVLGYYRPIKPVADGMIGLVLLGIFLAKGGKGGVGFFQGLENAFRNTTATPPEPNQIGGQQSQPLAGIPNGTSSAGSSLISGPAVDALQLESTATPSAPIAFSPQSTFALQDLGGLF